MNGPSLVARPATLLAGAGFAASVGSCLATAAIRYISGVPPLENRFQLGDLSVSAFLVLVLAFASVGAILSARRATHPVGWLLLVVGLAYGTQQAASAFLSAEIAARGSVTAAAAWAGWYVDLSGLAAGVALFSAFAMFPDGRVPLPGWSRWGRPIVAASIVLMAVWLVRPGPLWHFPLIQSPVALWPTELPAEVIVALTVPPVMGLMLIGVIPTLVWRARHANAIERQQLKWFGLAAVAASVTISVVTATGALLPKASPLGELPLTSFVLSAALIPPAIGIAILRYRLYDIDVVIRRTVVYGAVIVILGAIYLGLVLGLQSILTGVTGGTVPVALSTLAVAALFGPLQRAIHEAVDRRFYRSRYDAQRTIDSFASQLRGEVDLDAVRAELVQSVGRTLVPSYASVWLRTRRRQ